MTVSCGLSRQQGGVVGPEKEEFLEPGHRPSYSPAPGGSAHTIRHLCRPRWHLADCSGMQCHFLVFPSQLPCDVQPEGRSWFSIPEVSPHHHPSLTSYPHWAKPQRTGIISQAGTPRCQDWKALNVYLACPFYNAHMGKLRPRKGKGPLSSFAWPGSQWLDRAQAWCFLPASSAIQGSLEDTQETMSRPNRGHTSPGLGLLHPLWLCLE